MAKVTGVSGWLRCRVSSQVYCDAGKESVGVFRNLTSGRRRPSPPLLSFHIKMPPLPARGSRPSHAVRRGDKDWRAAEGTLGMGKLGTREQHKAANARVEGRCRLVGGLLWPTPGMERERMLRQGRR